MRNGRRTGRSGRRVYRVDPVPGYTARPAAPGGGGSLRARGRPARGSGLTRSAGLLLGALLGVGLATLQLGRLAGSGWRIVLAGSGTAGSTIADPAVADALVSATAASVAAVLAGWLLLGVLLTCLEVGVGQSSHAGRAAGRCARRVAPAVLRHGVAALLGVTLGVGTLSAAAANAAVAPLNSPATTSANATATVAAISGPTATSTAPTSTAPAGTAPTSTAPTSTAPTSTAGSTAAPAAADLSPGWTPTRPLARHTATTSSGTPLAGSRATRPQARAELGDEVVVRRGDTLWALAARHLGRDASDAQIALEWPTWFAANRKTIGDDPDLLRPGLRLQVPEQGGAR